MEELLGMSVVRAFIALSLSPEIYSSLDQVIHQLQERLPRPVVRWVPAHNIHLTLKFLGDVSLSNLEILKKILAVESGRQPPFEISVGELGAFPSIRRPRVIWVGIEAPPQLYELQRGIEAETARLGYAPEEREFSPHLTLGRVARNASTAEVRQLSDVLSEAKVGFLGAACIRDAHLFRSDLQPGGAIYTQLFSAPLAQDEG
jgi:2'-5' RNA ligase